MQNQGVISRTRQRLRRHKAGGRKKESTVQAKVEVKDWALRAMSKVKNMAYLVLDVFIALTTTIVANLQPALSYHRLRMCLVDMKRIFGMEIVRNSRQPRIYHWTHTSLRVDSQLFIKLHGRVARRWPRDDTRG
ncbi:hypothetical protein EVAR_12356_1 [Eumeta japonica]|uniref:Uncharacterized protein n=1 Tax=Eumeta variegata TaxID=151549 RepID=A0A4C1X314_EUMVA|nr:hypothetical protein EVAR_12356_1 [Eumeta japonica]